MSKKLAVAGTKPRMMEIKTDAPEPNDTCVSWRQRVLEIVLPVSTDGQTIHDADGKMLFQVRGWGALTSSKVPDEQAIDTQEQWCNLVVAKLNAENCERCKHLDDDELRDAQKTPF